LLEEFLGEGHGVLHEARTRSGVFPCLISFEERTTEGTVLPNNFEVLFTEEQCFWRLLETFGLELASNRADTPLASTEAAHAFVLPLLGRARGARLGLHTSKTVFEECIEPLVYLCAELADRQCLVKRAQGIKHKTQGITELCV
jgi:hypothetical protein